MCAPYTVMDRYIRRGKGSGKQITYCINSLLTLCLSIHPPRLHARIGSCRVSIGGKIPYKHFMWVWGKGNVLPPLVFLLLSFLGGKILCHFPPELCIFSKNTLQNFLLLTFRLDIPVDSRASSQVIFQYVHLYLSYSFLSISVINDHIFLFIPVTFCFILCKIQTDTCN